MWDVDKDFCDWLDRSNLGNDENPLNEDTLDLMYQAWKEGKGGTMPCRDEGEYRIYETQGQGEGTCISRHRTLDEALEMAERLWGGGCVRIEKPDGTNHEFDSVDWPKVLPRINLLRVCSRRLNPRQRAIARRWTEDRGLRGIFRNLRDHKPRNPEDIMSEMVDVLCDWRVAQEIFLESLAWGLFEIVVYTAGSPIPECRVLDEAEKAAEESFW